jgi:peptidoglycan-associated lipoprotein
MTRKAVVLSMAVLVMVVSTACARRPQSAGTSAPAPSGAAGTAPGGGQAGGDTAARAGSDAGTGAAGARDARATPVGPEAPVVPRPTVKEFTAVADLKDVYFDFDRYDIRPADARTLESNAKWLKDNAGYLLLIEGHADERGTDAYNMALGERRAKATMNYLVAQGIQATRINVVSYGEERPSCRERNEGCWARNRRAHFLVKPQ